MASREALDERAQRLIRTTTGLDPVMVEEYDIRELNPEDRAQVRVDRNLAPKERVQSYIWMMDAGDEFPALVMTDDGVIVDGNTRIRAHRERGDFTAPALVIPVAWADADGDLRARINYVGLHLNAFNGQPPTKEEQLAQIRNGIRIGLSDKQISTEAGVNPSAVKRERDRVAAAQRLEALGVEHDRDSGQLFPTGKSLIPDAALSKLGKADDLDDDAFVAVAELARDARFGAGEVQGVISKVREQPSEEARQDSVRRERDAQRQRIADIERGNSNGHPPAARAVKRALGTVLKHPAAKMVERNRDNAEEYLEAVEQAIAILTEVADLQREFNAEIVAAGVGADAGE